MKTARLAKLSPPGRTVTRPIGFAAASLAFVIVFVAPRHDARAARVELSGDATCGDREQIAEQASELLGRSLASIPGIDFAVTLSRPAATRWKLRLDTLESNEAEASAGKVRRSRELEAARCEDLADAAAVAIAMSVREFVPPEALAASTESSAAPAGPAAALAVPDARRTPLEPAAAHPAPAWRPIGFSANAAIVGAAGALPGPSAGLAVGGTSRWSRFILGLSGAAFVPRTAVVSSGQGGEVSLLAATVEGCVPMGEVSRPFLACVGFELGRLAAEGVGIARPRLGATLWEAVRADLGMSLDLGSRWTLVLSAGAALPLARPNFVIDGTTAIHRPDAVSIRVSAGIGIQL